MQHDQACAQLGCNHGKLYDTSANQLAQTCGAKHLVVWLVSRGGLVVEPTGAPTSGAADARRTKVADVNAGNVCNAVDGVLDAQLCLSKSVAAVASKQGSLSYAGNPGANSPALQQLMLPPHPGTQCLLTRSDV